MKKDQTNTHVLVTFKENDTYTFRAENIQTWIKLFSRYNQQKKILHKLNNMPPAAKVAIYLEEIYKKTGTHGAQSLCEPTCFLFAYKKKPGSQNVSVTTRRRGEMDIFKVICLNINKKSSSKKNYDHRIEFSIPAAGRTVGGGQKNADAFLRQEPRITIYQKNRRDKESFTFYFKDYLLHKPIQQNMEVQLVFKRRIKSTTSVHTDCVLYEKKFIFKKPDRWKQFCRHLMTFTDSQRKLPDMSRGFLHRSAFRRVLGGNVESSIISKTRNQSCIHEDFDLEQIVEEFDGKLDINDMLLTIETDEPYDFEQQFHKEHLSELESKFLDSNDDTEESTWFRRLFLFYRRGIYKDETPKMLLRLFKEEFKGGNIKTKEFILTLMEEWVLCYYTDMHLLNNADEFKIFIVPYEEENENSDSLRKLHSLQRRIQSGLDAGAKSYASIMHSKEEMKKKRDSEEEFVNFLKKNVKGEDTKQRPITDKMKWNRDKQLECMSVLDNWTDNSEHNNIYQDRRIRTQLWAEALTSIDRNAFLSLDIREFAHKSWARKKTKSFEAARILDLIDGYNYRTSWICSQILSRKTDKDRANCLRMMVDILHCCTKLSNWYSSFAINAAISHSAILRLKKAWELVPKSTHSKYKRVKVLLTPSKQFKNYRKQFYKNLLRLATEARKNGIPLAFPMALPRGNSHDGRKTKIIEGSQRGRSVDREFDVPATKAPVQKSSLLRISVSPSDRTRSGSRTGTVITRSRSASRGIDGSDFGMETLGYKPLFGKGSPSPQIPHLQVLLRDLFLLEEIPTFVKPTKLVNFHKYAKQWKELYPLLQCQYWLKMKVEQVERMSGHKSVRVAEKKLQNMYKSTLKYIFTDGDIWQMSYHCEAKGS